MKEKVWISTILQDDLLERWKALTEKSSRRPSDAFKLLLILVSESVKGKELLRVGGYRVD